MRVSGGKCLDLRIGQSHFVYILHAPCRAFGSHDLADIFLLVLNGLIEISVKGSLCHIPDNLYFWVLIPLPDGSACPLFQITGTPGAVQIVTGNDPVLHICPCAHLKSTAHKDTDSAPPDFGKQFLFAHIRIGVMDKGDLLRRDSPCQKFIPDVIVHTECTVCFWCGQVTEHKLRQLFLFSVFPVPVNFFHAGVDLAPRIIRQERVGKSLVQSQFSPVIGYLEHVVFPWIDFIVPHSLRTVSQFFHHFFLQFGRFYFYHPVFCLRHRQIQHICRLDVSHFPEHLHKFRQVVKPGKPCFQPVAVPLRCNLQSSHSLSKSRRPCVKML